MEESTEEARDGSLSDWRLPSEALGSRKSKGRNPIVCSICEQNEPGTQMYLAWQQKDDPTRFVHLFIFKDAAAQALHGQSEAVRRFESIYSPALIGRDVVFTDYQMVSGKVSEKGESIADTAPSIRRAG